MKCRIETISCMGDTDTPDLHTQIAAVSPGNGSTSLALPSPALLRRCRNNHWGARRCSRVVSTAAPLSALPLHRIDQGGAIVQVPRRRSRVGAVDTRYRRSSRVVSTAAPLSELLLRRIDKGGSCQRSKIVQVPRRRCRVGAVGACSGRSSQITVGACSRRSSRVSAASSSSLDRHSRVLPAAPSLALPPSFPLCQDDPGETPQRLAACQYCGGTSSSMAYSRVIAFGFCFPERISSRIATQLEEHPSSTRWYVQHDVCVLFAYDISTHTTFPFSNHREAAVARTRFRQRCFQESDMMSRRVWSPGE